MLVLKCYIKSPTDDSVPHFVFSLTDVEITAKFVYLALTFFFVGVLLFCSDSIKIM